MLKVKLWLLLIVGFCFSLLGMQHYRHKANVLRASLEVNKEINDVYKRVSKAKAEAMAEANRRVQAELAATDDERDVFERLHKYDS